ncbi:MAG: radical SAM protein [Salinivirgaceae bacterium]|jgi:MoaA/NifB/PqqE/SkfB family radical SAM enzyme|nr:radical SAM protein [Bacteroidales bacterium]
MIKTLDIEPTTICNLNCPFCFGPKVKKREVEIDLQVWKNALYKFRNKGVENIVISGGEPLMYNRIVELVKYLKHLNYRIVISSHGRYKEKLFEVAPYCDWISLPIDGITPEINHIMRTDNYPVSKIIATASELKSKHSNLKIKIGTLVTQKNIQEIIEVGNVLQDNSKCFDTWKIYQYTPRRKNKKNEKSLYISDKEFFDFSTLIKTSVSTKMKIVFSSNESRRNAYAFIYQNGDLNIVNIGDGFDDILVGNISDFNEINFQQIDELLNSNHYSNYTNTY